MYIGRVVSNTEGATTGVNSNLWQYLSLVMCTFVLKLTGNSANINLTRTIVS